MEEHKLKTKADNFFAEMRMPACAASRITGYLQHSLCVHLRKIGYLPDKKANFFLRIGSIVVASMLEVVIVLQDLKLKTDSCKF